MADYAFKIWEIFLKSPRFPTPGTFLVNGIKVEIYTDACARSPFETTSINWDYGVGIGGILVIDGDVVEFHQLEVGEKRGPHPSPWLKWLKSPLRLISFFELLGTYVGVRLWGPSRIGNQDLTWLGIPMVTDNLGNDFILRKHYTSTRPTSWALQELEVHSLTTNTAIISKHMAGDSAKWPIWAGKLSRNVYPQIFGEIQRAPDWEGPKFWLTNIREKSAFGLLGALSLKVGKRLANHPHLKAEFRS